MGSLRAVDIDNFLASCYLITCHFLQATAGCAASGQVTNIRERFPLGTELHLKLNENIKCSFFDGDNLFEKRINLIQNSLRMNSSNLATSYCLKAGFYNIDFHLKWDADSF